MEELAIHKYRLVCVLSHSKTAYLTNPITGMKGRGERSLWRGKVSELVNEVMQVFVKEGGDEIKKVRRKRGRG